MPDKSKTGGVPATSAAERQAEIMDTVPHEHHILPVWFFIGVVLVLYGVMIAATGIYEFSNPPDTVLANLHAPIWWGILLAVVGAVFAVRHRPR